ncbi:hypothetical protein [Ancylomarina sp. 16SWW S1-10-2]|uniref:hypothetical protein n=1 Tax=Ancylomarina sp. 16SWW S1-10-2 TaxID=2499681 RepID=UPI0012AE1FBE|nr:hypothetical protein [Ancylomarina sp. 16SWW S1-10-2]MRT92621.1 hypothetical protein [Ancylomarina sp. 16SWW S1-10-2]
MSKYLYSLIFLVFFFTSFSAKANIFDQDSTYTISEIGVLLDHPSLDKKEKKAFKEKFDSFWANTQLSSSKRDSILSICQIFRKKRARIVPDFYDYFNTLILFEEKGLSESDYSNWQNGLLHELRKPKSRLKKINDFIKQTIDLLKEQLLYKSFSTKWKTRSNNFHYFNDSTLKIVFDNTELVCYSQKDSCVIYKTSGTYYPFEKKWKGEKGEIAWTRAGKSPTDEYAIFKSYLLDITKAKIQIDSAQYKNAGLFNDFISGSLIEKVNIVKRPSSATYPRFKSFQNNISIDNLFENISYKGGIEIKGAKLIGKGNSEQPAKIELRRNDSLFLDASSEYFSLSNNKIIGQNTEITIHLDTFKIYHPNLHLKILTKEKELILTRDGTGMSQSPYFNNYHNLQMDFGILYWKMNDSIIHFRKMKGASHRLAKFESTNYFTKNHYQKLQGYDDKNPLVLLNGFAQHMYSNTFTTEEYANFIRKPLSQTRQQVIGLSFQGFVNYDASNDEITIEDRSSNYIASAMGKQDYDVIRFTSKTEKLEDDATLNLNNFDLQINGVGQVSVSNSQNITFVPKGGELLVKQNRDLEFSGLIKAGPLNLYGKDYNFSYDNFEVNMGMIDSLKAFIPIDDKGEFAKRNAIFLENIVKNTSANLQIDDPSNKSGNKSLEQYPIFNSYDSSYVYYEKPYIQNGVYKRDSFYIKVDPFTIDNINKISDQDIQFLGEFESGDITHNFRETLIVNKDNSIGFAHAIEDGGVLVYNKATFTDSLFLDNDGLWGKGTFTEKNTKIVSDHFILLPERAKGEAESYTLMGQKIPYSHPDISGKNIWVEWESSKDQFRIQSRGKNDPLSMYKGHASLAGIINITNDKMTGAGEMTYANGSFISKYFNYSGNKITADTTDFKLLSHNKIGYTFKAEMCNAIIDLENQRSNFISTISGNYSSLPSNNYICQLNSFKWNMANDQIEFGSEELDKLNLLWESGEINALPKTSYNTFISTKSDQDSLSFVTPYAIYDTTNYTISAKFVEKLKIADADILPLHGNLTINNDGYLEPLSNCEILADTLNKFHKITDALVDVNGRRDYTGSGFYTYKDDLDEEQEIYFKEISVDSTGQTIAQGPLTDAMEFSLSPDFDFRGEVQLSAKEQYLRFNGETQIHNKCHNIESRWLSFNATIDPKDILIPIDTIGRDKENVKIFNSLYLTNDSIHIYPAFLSTREFYTDNPILTVDGFLSYNKSENLYQIASKEKIKNPEQPGNLLSYNMNNCNLTGEGLLNLGVKLGHVTTTTAGTFEYDSDKKEVFIKTCLGFNFYFSEQLLKMINKHYSNSVQQASNLNNDQFLRTFPLILPKEEANKIVTEIKTTNTYKTLPDTIKQTLFFNQVNLEWNKEEKAYYSYGELELGSIFNTTYNSVVKGKIEIRKRRKGNRMYLYMELEDGDWFYFEYQNQVMFMRSSISEINLAMEEVKEDERRFRHPETNLNYLYLLAPISKVTRFKKRHELE